MKAAIEHFTKHCRERRWPTAAEAAAQLPEDGIQRINVIFYEPDYAHRRGQMTLRIYLSKGGYIETLRLSPSDPSMVLLIRAAKITLEGLAAQEAAFAETAKKYDVIYPLLADGGGGILMEADDAKIE